MDSPRYSISLLVLITIFFHMQRSASSTPQHDHNSRRNCSSSCGNIHNITFPFRLKTDPSNCGASFHGYELSCEKNRATIIIKKHHYYVQAINYHNYTIRVASPDVHNDNCSSIPFSSLSTEDNPRYAYNHQESVLHNGKVRQIPEALNFFSCEKENCSSIPLYNSLETRDIGYLNTTTYPKLETVIRFGSAKETHQVSETLVFLGCEKPVPNNPLYIDTAPCINSSSFTQKDKGDKKYSYVVYGNGFKFLDMEESCQIFLLALVSSPRRGETRKKINSYTDIHDELVYGFELSWVQAFQESQASLCYVDEDSNKVYCPPKLNEIVRIVLDEVLFLARLANTLTTYAPIWIVQRTIAISFLACFIIYKWRRRHLSAYDGIEAFLQSPNNLLPLRYTYSEVRKMAQGFKTKLGEGGFGSVYKGKLHNGRFAAIKILGKSKDDGLDFINEVATIGKIHHVNVVRLIGFCVEGSKRALIYDFMPSGSLDKYIFSGEEVNNSLSTKEMFDISLGVARGIEYLHRGCDMQILHFDIKPHNILLDENFVPKVSDFGLARLCPLDNGIVSLTGARGTIGYIAPELFYKNIGGVSHKADVYSFGMLLMEMASRRKNLNAVAEHSSQIFFPLWMHDQLKKEKAIVKENVSEEEPKTTKKMIIVALWCIQLKPSDRPSMKEVIEMLEGEVECLQMPPKPCLFPREEYNAKDHYTEDTCNASNTSLALPDEDSTESV